MKKNDLTHPGARSQLNLRASRKRLVDWMRRQIIGPGSALDVSDAGFDLKGVRPSETYQCGVLFPITEHGVDPASSLDDSEALVAEATSSTDGSDEATDQDADAERIKTIRYVPPSSVGFSFYVEGAPAALELRCWAVRYEPERGHGPKGETIWKRIPCARADDIIRDVPSPSSNNAEYAPSYRVFELSAGQKSSPQESNTNRGLVGAMLQALWRPYGKGWMDCHNLALQHAENDRSSRCRIGGFATVRTVSGLSSVLPSLRFCSSWDTIVQ